MKICAIYGTERMGCTWHIAQEVLSRRAERTAARLRKGAAGPCLKTRLLFHFTRLTHKYVWRDSPDAKWWREHGWLGRERPWKP